MADTFSKEIVCVLCNETYSPVIEPEEGQSAYKLYCNSCTQWRPISRRDPVRATLRQVLNIKGEALALALQSVVSDCTCGGNFTHDAGERCLECIGKIQVENVKAGRTGSENFICPWNLEALKKFEGKIFDYIYQNIQSKEENLTTLIEKYESGQIDAETYMEAVESLPFREAKQVAAIQTWSMIVGPDLVFRAAEEHGLVERYGTRILVSIADGLEMSTGRSVLATLSREKNNWDGPVHKELATFIKKIGGGF